MSADRERTTVTGSVTARQLDALSFLKHFTPLGCYRRYRIPVMALGSRATAQHARPQVLEPARDDQTVRRSMDSAGRDRVPS